jgi:hypothetical protein
MVEPEGMGGMGSPVPKRAISPSGKVIRTVPVKLGFKAISLRAGLAPKKTKTAVKMASFFRSLILGLQTSDLKLYTPYFIAGIDRVFIDHKIDFLDVGAVHTSCQKGSQEFVVTAGDINILHEINRLVTGGIFHFHL